MTKDFDRWNTEKKRLNESDDRLYFREGEMWWVALGVNVGFEMDGKRSDFSRPVLVLKKYNQYSFLALPLTTNARANPYRIALGFVDGKQSFAVLSQLRNIDSARLINKAAVVD
jgi:mRNA interferase MazF